MKINALDEFLDINFTGYSQSQQIEKTYNLKVFGSKITKGPKQDRQKSATITSGWREMNFSSGKYLHYLLTGNSNKKYI